MAGDERDGGSLGFDVTVAHPLSACCGVGRKPRGGS